jgi:23S rRNA (cytidine2498-2'-O)-methyltransferase
MPREALAARAGRYVWTCRAGFEAHLFEELAWAGATPRLLGPALVESDARPGLQPVFGRVGFRAVTSLEAGDEPASSERIASELVKSAPDRALHVQGWAVDEPRSLARSAEAEALAEAVATALPESRRAPTAAIAKERDGVLAQICAVQSTLWIVGWVRAAEAVSLAPGGRRRMRRAGEAPSRAGMKLDEALAQLGHEPGRGEVCADLGAAPGGWTQRLVERGARVLAVDPARLRAELDRHPKVRHLAQSAFAFEPDEPVDWLFCDMAWRPLEVAQLLAKWGRRGWAMHLVANIKLPMRDKNPILFRVRWILEEAGWRHLAIRQLYHDRDEVTVTARRLA